MTLFLPFFSLFSPLYARSLYLFFCLFLSQSEPLFISLSLSLSLSLCLTVRDSDPIKIFINISFPSLHVCSISNSLMSTRQCIRSVYAYDWSSIFLNHCSVVMFLYFCGFLTAIEISSFHLSHLSCL